MDASWRMVGDLALPWNPQIDLKGRTRFTIDPAREGRIVSYDEKWAIDAGTALRQIVTPRWGGGDAAGGGSEVAAQDFSPTPAEVPSAPRTAVQAGGSVPVAEYWPKRLEGMPPPPPLPAACLGGTKAPPVVILPGFGGWCLLVPEAPPPPLLRMPADSVCHTPHPTSQLITAMRQYRLHTSSHTLVNDGGAPLPPFHPSQFPPFPPPHPPHSPSGNDQIDYIAPLGQEDEVGFVSALQRRGFDDVTVVDVARGNWLQVARGLLDVNFIRNNATADGLAFVSYTYGATPPGHKLSHVTPVSSHSFFPELVSSEGAGECGGGGGARGR